MKLIDTHTHIYSEEFNKDISEVISRAINEGFDKLLLPNIDSESLSRLYKLVDQYPNNCLPMIGIHPTSIKGNYQEELDVLHKEISKHKFYAIGEIGIDLYWDKTFINEQKDAFEQQLYWSIENDLPVSIHARNATQEVIEIINKVGSTKLKGVFHSFVGDDLELQELLKFENFILGINGVVTYKNSTLREVLKKAPLNRIVIETDAPYLTPVPYRGKRNEPSYAIHIANELAKIYETSVEDIAKITTENATEMFRLE